MGEGGDGQTFTSGEFFTAVAGLAALRHVITDPDRARPHVETAVAVARAMDEPPNDIVIPVVEHDVETGYAAWAPTYDGANPAIALEEPIVHAIVDALPPGRALDAGCGTGRHAARLATQGWDVVGVDATHGMLEVARAKAPEVRFEQGDLLDLPVADDAVDLTICSLALSHVPDLAAGYAELARATRPGGTVVIADIHPTWVALGGTAAFPHGDGLAHVRDLLHPIGHHVRAAHAAGLEILDCTEVAPDEAMLTSHLAHPFVPDAVVEAYQGIPFLLIWHLRAAGSPEA